LLPSPPGPGILRGARQRPGPGEEVRVEDESRKTLTVVEAAEYLGLTRSTVQEMVDRGELKADKFAGAVHIPREEVERVERETAP
jgi:excisionase family DNA binding protein